MQSYRKLVKDNYIVPQNSVSTFNQRGNLAGNKTAQCPHCEIMAKNFLYLESLIRNNYNPKIPCKLCFASLKYLQFVNKSIMSVFGSCDAVVNAAKCFFGPIKKIPSQHIRKRKSAVHLSKNNTKRIRAGGNVDARAAVPPAGGNNTQTSKPPATQVAAAANSHEYSANSKTIRRKTRHKVHNKRLISNKSNTQVPEKVVKFKSLRRPYGPTKKSIKSLS